MVEMGLVSLLVISAGLFGVILLVLLFAWALQPSSRRPRREVKENLRKIKDQINGEDE
jgi:flagellar biogenesis protein FliO